MKSKTLVENLERVKQEAEIMANEVSQQDEIKCHYHL